VLSTTASSSSVPRDPTIAGGVERLNEEAPVDRIRRVRVLLVSPDANARDLMRVAVGSIERRLGEPVAFLDAENGEQGARVGLRERPDAVVADEIASRAGAFALAKDLRGAQDPYRGPIVIVLERKHDAWLARWSGADAWFVRPVDPFQLADRLVELIRRDRDQPRDQPKDQRETA
jgi:DNA-binding response OmpR family regulator